MISRDSKTIFDVTIEIINLKCFLAYAKRLKMILSTQMTVYQHAFSIFCVQYFLSQVLLQSCLKRHQNKNNHSRFAGSFSPLLTVWQFSLSPREAKCEMVHAALLENQSVHERASLYIGFYFTPKLSAVCFFTASI